MQKSSARFGFLKYALVLAGVLLIDGTAMSATSPVIARTDPSASTYSKQARGKVPGRRRGGARRGTCPNTSTELTALVPAIEIPTQTLPETFVGSSTVAEHPTFWFYVPYSLTGDLTAEFILQNDIGQDVYRITSADFSESEQTPGIVGISLPSAIAPLEIGRVYQWYFKVDCGSESPLYVRGGIERVALEPNLANQLANASPQEQARLYQSNEIWYDAIAVLAQLYRTEPNNPTIEAAWADLLQSIGL